MNKQTVISFTDLQVVSIRCPHCKTRVLLDMTAEFKPSGQRRDFMPQSCPGCETAFDSAIQNLNALQRVYSAVMAAHLEEGTITFVTELGVPNERFECTEVRR